LVRLQRPLPVRAGSRSVLVLRQALLHLLVQLPLLVPLQRQLNQQRCVFFSCLYFCCVATSTIFFLDVHFIFKQAEARKQLFDAVQKGNEELIKTCIANGAGTRGRQYGGVRGAAFVLFM